VLEIQRKSFEIHNEALVPRQVTFGILKDKLKFWLKLEKTRESRELRRNKKLNFGVEK
jgi:hypothetical protein